MEKSEFYGLANIKEALQNACTEQIPSYSYSVPLEKGEIEEMNLEINQALEVLAELKLRRSELTALAKIENEKIQENHRDIMAGSKQITGTVYKVLDNHTGIMHWITEEGMTIDKVRVKQAQMNVFNSMGSQEQEAV